MPISSGVGLLIGGGLSAAGGITSSLLGANAAGKAASTQAQAAEEAAQLQHEDAQAALQFQEQEFGQAQANEAPFLQGGSSAEANLLSLMGIEPSSFASTPTPGTFLVPQPGQPGQTGLAPNPFATPDAQLTVPSPAGGDGAFAQPFTSGQPGGNMVPMSSLLSGVDPSSFSAVAPGGRFPGGLTNAPQGGPIMDPLQGPVTATNGPATGATPQSATSTAPGFLGPPTAAPGSPSSMVPLSSLVNPALGAPGSLMEQWPFQFQAPTDVTEQNDPGFQFRLNQGEQALNNSAAARGSLLSGGSAKALQQYAQNYASGEYQNVYNRSLTDYQQAYNQFQQGQANQFNRLASIAGMGQVSAGQLNSAGASAANSVGNTLLTSGAQIGQDLNNAGAARASGYVGQANAYGGGLSSLSNFGSMIPLLSLLSQQQGGAV
ncbi:MAG TPA: hypothetical protein VKY85_07585 [Candidatus Angelobacter sp.]|nr:hypothetical protein [Candidatus Angelobacter sp.]